MNWGRYLREFKRTLRTLSQCLTIYSFKFRYKFTIVDENRLNETKRVNNRSFKWLLFFGVYSYLPTTGAADLTKPSIFKYCILGGAWYQWYSFWSVVVIRHPNTAQTFLLLDVIRSDKSVISIQLGTIASTIWAREVAHVARHYCLWYRYNSALLPALYEPEKWLI